MNKIIKAKTLNFFRFQHFSVKKFGEIVNVPKQQQQFTNFFFSKSTIDFRQAQNFQDLTKILNQTKFDQNLKKSLTSKADFHNFVKQTNFLSQKLKQEDIEELSYLKLSLIIIKDNLENVLQLNDSRFLPKQQTLLFQNLLQLQKISFQFGIKFYEGQNFVSHISTQISLIEEFSNFLNDNEQQQNILAIIDKTDNIKVLNRMLKYLKSCRNYLNEKIYNNQVQELQFPQDFLIFAKALKNIQNSQNLKDFKAKYTQLVSGFINGLNLNFDGINLKESYLINFLDNLKFINFFEELQQWESKEFVLKQVDEIMQQVYTKVDQLSDSRTAIIILTKLAKMVFNKEQDIRNLINIYKVKDSVTQVVILEFFQDKELSSKLKEMIKNFSEEEIQYLQEKQVISSQILQIPQEFREQNIIYKQSQGNNDAMVKPQSQIEAKKERIISQLLNFDNKPDSGKVEDIKIISKLREIEKGLADFSARKTYLKDFKNKGETYKSLYNLLTENIKEIDRLRVQSLFFIIRSLDPNIIFTLSNQNQENLHEFIKIRLISESPQNLCSTLYMLAQIHYKVEFKQELVNIIINQLQLDPNTIQNIIRSKDIDLLLRSFGLYQDQIQIKEKINIQDQFKIQIQRNIEENAGNIEYSNVVCEHIYYKITKEGQRQKFYRPLVRQMVEGLEKSEYTRVNIFSIAKLIKAISKFEPVFGLIDQFFQIVEINLNKISYREIGFVYGVMIQNIRQSKDENQGIIDKRTEIIKKIEENLKKFEKDKKIPKFEISRIFSSISNVFQSYSSDLDQFIIESITQQDYEYFNNQKGQLDIGMLLMILWNLSINQNIETQQLQKFIKKFESTIINVLDQVSKAKLQQQQKYKSHSKNVSDTIQDIHVHQVAEFFEYLNLRTGYLEQNLENLRNLIRKNQIFEQQQKQLLNNRDVQSFSQNDVQFTVSQVLKDFNISQEIFIYPFKVDILCQKYEYKIIIESNGYQHYYNEKIKQSDIMRKLYLEKLGYEVVFIDIQEWNKVQIQDRQAYIINVLKENKIEF